jgi:chemotaxis protein histidine kinase CheA
MPESFENPTTSQNEEESPLEKVEDIEEKTPEEATEETAKITEEEQQKEMPLEDIEEEVPKESQETTKEEELIRIEEKIKMAQEQTLEEKEAVEEKKQKEERKELVKEVVGEKLPEKFKDLVGDNSEEAWEKRKELFEKDPAYTAASLAGVASEESRVWLESNKDSQKMWWGISRGLIGDDSEKAWEIREHLKVDEKVDRTRGERLANIKKTLGLQKSETLFNLRGKAKQLLGWYEPGDVVISTTGLDSEKAWKLREEMEKIAPAEVLISLAGVDSEKAQELREKYKGDKKLNWALQKSLASAEK